MIENRCDTLSKSSNIPYAGRYNSTWKIISL